MLMRPKTSCVMTLDGSPEQRIPRPGELLAGKYRVERILGAGGMGNVIAATHVHLGEEVAIKLLRRDSRLPDRSSERFMREARAMSRIRSEHVVRVYDVAMLEDGSPYIVMELLQGHDLAHVVATGKPLQVRTVVDYVLQACEAVAEAHARGIVHRDLKPANLFLTRRVDGSVCVKVLDFGISKVAAATGPRSSEQMREGGDVPTAGETTLDPPAQGAAPFRETDASLTMPGAWLGSPRYMSPEQMRGSPEVDARSDIWSIGVILYELLANHPPFDGHSGLQLQQAVLEAEPAPLAASRPDVPPSLEGAIRVCLSKLPSQRYATIAALADAVVPFASRAGRASWATIIRVARAPTDVDDVSESALQEAAGPSFAGTGGKSSSLVGTGGGHASRAGVPPRAPAGGASTVAALPRARSWLTVGAVSLVLAGAGFLALRRVPPKSAAPPAASMPPAAPAPSFRPTNLRRVTTGSCDEFPALTPDGAALVYDAEAGKSWSLFVMDLRTSAVRRLTHVEHATDYESSVSPDGQQVAFKRAAPEGQPSGVFVMDLVGKEPPRLVTPVAYRPSWSRDGRSLWVDDRTRWRRHDVETGRELERVDPPQGRLPGPLLEVEGDRLVAVFPRFQNTTSGGVGLYAPDRTLRILHEGDLETALAMTSDRAAALVAEMKAAANPELLEVPLDGRTVVSLASSGIAPRKGMTMSTDGRVLAWSTCRPIIELSSLDKTGNLVAYGSPHEWDEIALARVPNSTAWVVVSNESGSEQPWLMGPDGPPRKIDVGPGRVMSVAVSPDGTRLAFGIPGEGVGIASLGPTPGARMLTRGKSHADPSFTRDGKAILFTAQRDDGTYAIVSVAVDGGEPKQVLGPGARSPVASPTEDLVAYLAGDTDAALVPMLLSTRTGLTRPLVAEGSLVSAFAVRFIPDGRRVGVLHGRGRFTEVDAHTGAALRSVATEDVNGFDYIGGEAVFIRTRYLGNVWVADDPFGAP
jgi:serine/threonine-protein kinase